MRAGPTSSNQSRQPVAFRIVLAMMTVAERSFEKLTEADLARIRDLAFAELARVYSRTKVASQYRDRMILLALCQGAAKHWADGKHGVKDIDVWAFYRAGLPSRFPYRKRWTADLGASRFGKHPDDPGFVGRRIDILGRSIPCAASEAPEAAVRAWLQSKTESAGLVAQRPVIGLWPEPLFAKPVWVPV